MIILIRTQIRWRFTFSALFMQRHIVVTTRQALIQIRIQIRDAYTLLQTNSRNSMRITWISMAGNAETRMRTFIYAFMLNIKRFKYYEHTNGPVSSR